MRSLHVKHLLSVQVDLLTRQTLADQFVLLVELVEQMCRDGESVTQPDALAAPVILLPDILVAGLARSNEYDAGNPGKGICHFLSMAARFPGPPARVRASWLRPRGQVDLGAASRLPRGPRTGEGTVVLRTRTPRWARVPFTGSKEVHWSGSDALGELVVESLTEAVGPHVERTDAQAVAQCRLRSSQLEPFNHQLPVWEIGDAVECAPRV